jgi:hypothetical protein
MSMRVLSDSNNNNYYNTKHKKISYDGWYPLQNVGFGYFPSKLNLHCKGAKKICKPGLFRRLVPRGSVAVNLQAREQSQPEGARPSTCEPRVLIEKTRIGTRWEKCVDGVAGAACVRRADVHRAAGATGATGSAGGVRGPPAQRARRRRGPARGTGEHGQQVLPGRTESAVLGVAARRARAIGGGDDRAASPPGTRRPARSTPPLPATAPSARWLGALPPRLRAGRARGARPRPPTAQSPRVGPAGT